jgi:hypothetical protein
MKTVRVWVPCKVWIETPVTHMERTTECVPVTHQVTVCKHELRQEQVPVTCWKSVPEEHTECYTVMVPHQVPFQTTRTVSVCVPHQETVTCCRMVPHTVEKQVPVDCCGETTCCKAECCKSRHFSGLRLRVKDCGCE